MVSLLLLGLYGMGRSRLKVGRSGTCATYCKVDSRFRIPDSGFQIPDSRFRILGYLHTADDSLQPKYGAESITNQSLPSRPCAQETIVVPPILLRAAPDIGPAMAFARLLVL